jgi:hypothetical protein
MKFLCLGYYDEKKFEALPKPELEELVRKCRTHDEALHQSGRLLLVGSLDSPAKAASIRPRNNKSSVTDGPYAEAKEVIGAFFLIEAEDRAEAIRIAALHPAAQLGEQVGWGVEVRGVDFFEEAK